jgi:pimeloyl-ACP methyl ester carboxylesterase
MLVLALSLLFAPQARGRSEVRTEEVEFQNGAIALAATLHLPVASRPVADVVLIHGSGSSDRSNPWTATYARDLAARGIAVLHPDKRGSGKSKGEWRTASIEELAADAGAGVAYLSELPEIDPERIGVAGFSQGGYVAAVVAADVAGCAFAITISGSTLPFLDQVVDEIALEAARAGAPLTEGELVRVRELHVLALRFARTGEAFEELQAQIATARAESPRLKSALRGIPGKADDPIFGFMRAVGEFDPLPSWLRSKRPALLVFGGQDTQVRGRKSEERLLDAIGEEARQVTVVHFQKNAHALHRADLVDFLASWIDRRGE